MDLPRQAPASLACPYCRSVVLDLNEERRVTLIGGAGDGTVERNWFVLPPAEEWYFRRWNLDYKPLPPELNLGGTGTIQASLPGERNLALFNPEPGAQVYIPRELDGREGRIVFQAAHRSETGVIYWHLDGTYLGSTHTFHEIEARPPAGPRTLTLVDADGNTLTRNFTVLENVE